MKILVSGFHNPDFQTVTDYFEAAIRKAGHTLALFDNRAFLFPGRIRRGFPRLQEWDLARLNRRLVSCARAFGPVLFLEIGGDRILPQTVLALKKIGAVTALWTTDPPHDADMPLHRYASSYDFIFSSGSEAQEILIAHGRADAHLVPFACDEEAHAPVELAPVDRKRYAADIVFVGSIHPASYPWRIEILTSIADFGLGIWGPGSESIDAASPLRRLIRGDKTTPQEWVKIYRAAKIVLCMHYRDPQGAMAVNQVSTRVFEALACKCFLLVDRQRDVERFFQDGKHLVVFQDIADLRQKLKYYLEHPEERASIAEAGYKEVLQKHTYGHRLREMLGVIGVPDA